MKGSTLALATIVMCFAGNVNAYDVPSFSLEGYCLVVSEYEGGDENVYKGCMELEKKSYKKVLRRWDDFPENIQEQCIAVAMTRKSYYDLQDCLGSVEEKNYASSPNQN